MIASYLALLMKEDGVSDTEIGLLAIPFSLSLVISNSFSGRLSDYRGRKQFILIGLILSSISTNFYVFSINLWTYFLARIINGIALGIFPSSLIGLASDNNVKLGWLSSFGSMGWAFGGLVGGILADEYSLSFVFIYSSFMYLSAFIFSLYLQDDSEVNTKSRNHSREIYYIQVIRKNWLIYLIVIFRHGTANAIWIFWPIFLSEELNLSITQIGIVQATNMFTQFIFMQILGDKIDPRKMYFVGSFFSSLAFYSFTLVTNFNQIVGTQIILGFSWALFYVGGLRLVEERSKQSSTVATATGLYNSSISVAQIVGPFIALFFLRFSNSFVNTMLFAAVVTIFAGVFYGLNELYSAKSNAIST